MADRATINLRPEVAALDFLFDYETLTLMLLLMLEAERKPSTGDSSTTHTDGGTAPVDMEGTASKFERDRAANE